MKPVYMKLFDSIRHDLSVWHGKPETQFAFGHQQLFGNSAVNNHIAVNDVDTSVNYSISNENKRSPSYCCGTIRAVVADAINVWCENEQLQRDDFVRDQSNWYPSHLAGRWTGRNIGIEFSVCGQSDNLAVFQVIITNNSVTSFNGNLIFAGDNNVLNCNQSWYQSDSQVTINQDAVVVDKRIDIGLPPDFFPFYNNLASDRQFFHWFEGHYQLAWAFFQSEFKLEEIKLPNGISTWKRTQKITLNAGESKVFQVGFAGNWLGKTHKRTKVSSLIKRAQAAQTTDFRLALKNARIEWEDFFARLPVPSDKWSLEEQELYYKAWCTVRYNVWPASDLIMYKTRHRTVSCNRICNGSFVYPATWETSIGALLLGCYVEPGLGEDILESLVDAIEDDGFLGEAPGHHRNTQLVSMEPAVAWLIYKKSGNKEFLKRTFKPLYSNLKYKFNNPNWRHLTGPSVRNYSYATLSAIAMSKISRIIGAPSVMIANIDRYVADGLRAIDAFYDVKKGFYRSHLMLHLPGHGAEFSPGTAAEALIPLFPGLHRPEYRARLLKTIKENFLSPDNLIVRAPHGIEHSGTFTTGPERSDWSLKESNLVYLLPALRLFDPETHDQIAHAVVKNIIKTNDFYECYTIHGEGKHNGPGSIFGAFGVIWSILSADGQLNDFIDSFKIEE